MAFIATGFICIIAAAIWWDEGNLSLQLPMIAVLLWLLAAMNAYWANRQLFDKKAK